ncbi:antirestriction protein ArdA [Desulfitobacterium hafniense]|uniref:antirestriction protein ArdA n=1 Tax=Desulfitobacterium hafniense TaxID=49338 RepID=UPI00037815E4|nr:antirestriction protein ArdA [Desulfitobacterium hafniense]
MLKVYLIRGNQGQGVWLDLPTSPAEMGEAYAVLDGIDSENLNTRISATISSVPNLKKYIHEYDSLEQLDTLATAINKMSDRDAAIFSGALDLESVNGIKDLMRITNNLQNYKFFPDVTTPRELGIYLVESGDIDIHESAWPYLDYEKVAAVYESNHVGVYTHLGYVVKNDSNPTQTISEKEQIGGGTLKAKGYRVHPSVGIIDGELWRAVTARLRAPFSDEETAEPRDFVMKPHTAPDPGSNTQVPLGPADDKEYIFKLIVYPSYDPDARDKGFTLKLPMSIQELGLTLKKRGITDFNDCDVESCECHIKRLSNTLNLEGDLYGLNKLATQIKHLLDDKEPITKLLAALEEERPRELSEAIDIMDNLDCYELLPPNIKTPADYAGQVLFDSGRYEINDEVKDFLDLDKYGKYKMEEDGVRQSVFGMLRRIDGLSQEQEQGFTLQMGGI